METALTFGQRVRARREALGLTQDELAQRMATHIPSGHWNRANISKIEHGRHNPSQHAELALAAALDVPMSWLWGAEPPGLLTPTQRAIVSLLATWSAVAQEHLRRRLEAVEMDLRVMPAPDAQAGRRANH